MDPYGVELECFDDIYTEPINDIKAIPTKETIVGTLLEDQDLTVYGSNHFDYHSKEICMVLGKIKIESGKVRQQPIFIEMEYCPIVSDLYDEIVYVLVLKTLLGNKKDVKQYFNQFEKFRSDYVNKYVTSKLCVDESQSERSNFYIYMRTEIPLFPVSGFYELSNQEVKVSINNLINWADSIERVTFGDKKRSSTVFS